MPPEVDFPDTAIDQIAKLFRENGCVLLRRFCAPAVLHLLHSRLDAIHEAINEFHIFPQHLDEYGLAPPQEYLFFEKHHALLAHIFGGESYRDQRNNVTRRIDTEPHGAGWQEPLGPHLDAFLHPLGFTVNFWVPFQICGITLPSLGVVCAPFNEIMRFVGYQNAAISEDKGDPFLNFGRFRPEMKALWLNDSAAVAQMREYFGDRIWTPAYDRGDAMILSNWTLHFTHVTADMVGRRENIEMRFCSELPVARIAS